MLTGGTFLRTIVGDAFDIVGFDPRGMCLLSLSCTFVLIYLLGVSRSIPVASFFANNVDREIWSARASVFNVVNTSTNDLGELGASSRLVGQLAGATNHDGYLNFISTASAAQDMLQITKAYGLDKVQYWGFS